MGILPVLVIFARGLLKNENAIDFWQNSLVMEIAAAKTKSAL